jgi:hypothetical protein
MFGFVHNWIKGVRRRLIGLSGETLEIARSRERRPEGMSRRGFLKALGVTTVVVATGDWSKVLAEPVYGEPCAWCRQQWMASDCVNDFTRTKMREDGFYRRIMPPTPIPNDQLDRQVPPTGYDWGPNNTLIRKEAPPVQIVDKTPTKGWKNFSLKDLAELPQPMEPVTVLTGTELPKDLYIRGPRYKVEFDRLNDAIFEKLSPKRCTCGRKGVKTAADLLRERSLREAEAEARRIADMPRDPQDRYEDDDTDDFEGYNIGPAVQRPSGLIVANFR